MLLASYYKNYNTSFNKLCNRLVEQILWTTLSFQDNNSRYSKDLIENSLSFLEGIDENERQVELGKLSKHPCRLVLVERSFEQPLQNACRNLSKEGLKIKYHLNMT